MSNISKKPLAYQLGYNAAKEPKKSINYKEKLDIPIYSFSNPKIQRKQYISGWNAGRQIFRKNKKKK